MQTRGSRLTEGPHPCRHIAVTRVFADLYGVCNVIQFGQVGGFEGRLLLICRKGLLDALVVDAMVVFGLACSFFLVCLQYLFVFCFDILMHVDLRFGNHQ